MSQDRLTAIRLLSYCWLTVMLPPNNLAFNIVYNKEPSSSSSLQSPAFYQGTHFNIHNYVYYIVDECTVQYKMKTIFTNFDNLIFQCSLCSMNYFCYNFLQKIIIDSIKYRLLVIEYWTG